MHLLGRDVVYLISLNMSNLNARRNAQERVIKCNSSTGHAQSEFSQK